MKQQLETARNFPKIPSIKDLSKAMSPTELTENVILLLLCRICFMEYLVSPFGVALFSVLFYRKRRLSYVIASVAGTLLSGIPVFYFKYIGTILIAMSLIIIFSKELKSKSRTVSAITTAALLLNGGVYVFVEGFFVYDTLLLILECCLCYLSFFCFDCATASMEHFTKRKIFEPKEIVSMVILFGCCVLSISLTENLLPVAHIIAIFGILFLSVTCGFTVSTPAGAVLGLSLGFVSAYPAQLVCTYTLSSLFSGVCARYGKLASSGIFALCTFFVTILISPEANGFLPVSYVAVAWLLVFFVPEKVIASFGTAATKPLNISRKEARIKDELYDAFDISFNTLDSVADIFSDIIKEGSAIEVSDNSVILENTANAICTNCSLYRFCWQKEKQKTLLAIENLLPCTEASLRKNHIPKEFSDICIRRDAFIRELNKNAESYKITKMWSGKVVESKKLVAEQFKNLSMILTDVRDNLSSGITFSSDTESKIAVALDKMGISFSKVKVLSSDGFVVEIHNPDFYINSHADKKIENVLSEIFDVPMVMTSSSYEKIVFCQKTEFAASLHISVLPRKNSDHCGDNCAYFYFGTGKLAIVLSDGMGSGEAAAFQSNLVVTLAKKLLSSGFSLRTCVRLINNILMTNADRETFATVDLCVVDMYSGIAEFAKTGAAPSYIKKEDEEIVISSSSLPAGLINSADTDFCVKYLQAGDWVVLASDGITDTLDCPDKNEIFEICNEFDGTPEELAESILNLALKRSGGIATDDLCVCVCKLEKNL